jgi:hypothetical protein
MTRLNKALAKKGSQRNMRHCASVNTGSVGDWSGRRIGMGVAQYGDVVVIGWQGGRVEAEIETGCRFAAV